MTGNSLDILEDRLEKLKQVFPELFTENQLDWEKLQATFTDQINFSNERYVLTWAGKANAYKSLQHRDITPPFIYLRIPKTTQRYICWLRNLEDC